MKVMLEDSESDRHNEREERQLERVPRLQTKHTECHRDEGHGLQQDEHHDRDDDLLQLGFACLNSAATSSWEVERHIQLILFEVTWRHGHTGTGNRHFEGDIMAAQVVLDLLHYTSWCTTLTHKSSIAAHFYVIGDLIREKGFR
uniref:Uncharacterized protein n=1 Tax=Anopheles culicifacies TaxID=139723 RepID=A0A182MLH8_9DIPT